MDWRRGGFALLVLALAGCETVEEIVDVYRPATPHEAYLAGLHEAGLAGTALSQAWIHEAAEAVRNPLEVELPLLDEGWFSAGEPTAVGYRFFLPRGREITVSLEVEAEAGGRVFLDLLRIAEDPEAPPRPVEADTLPDGSLRYEPYRAGEYLVRAQPELLHGGRYRLRIAEDPALAFPVVGHGMRSIQSVFGVARDGGRRSHHGVDIFARRGTPVIAAADGEVNRVEITNLGGKVVWLRDERMRRNLYYAHLDSQAVIDGQRVRMGDTLGFVGNSGNAITTPPHLHFGIYSRGPTDPDPFLRPTPRIMAELAVDPTAYGSRVRTVSAGIRLRSGPSRNGAQLASLEVSTPMRVIGGSGDWFRVELPDGSQGYIAARLTEPAEAPLERMALRTGEEIRSGPRLSAPALEIPSTPVELELLGRVAGWALVRTAEGSSGWIRSRPAEVEMETPEAPEAG